MSSMRLRGSAACRRARDMRLPWERAGVSGTEAVLQEQFSPNTRPIASDFDLHLSYLMCTALISVSLALAAFSPTSHFQLH